MQNPWFVFPALTGQYEFLSSRTQMKKFIDTGWQFGAEADATAKSGDKGAAAAKEAGADTGGNLFEIYQMTDSGVALQATVAGTKYWKDTDLNK